MNSRERVRTALRHKEPDRVPVDFGGSAGTGMHVSCVYAIRQALGLDEPGTPIRVVEPYQMLGEIKADLMDLFGVDVVSLGGSRNIFGFRNDGWKPWTMFDGTPVLVPEWFNTIPAPNGDILMYPEGDRSAPPSARMPNGGWFFDAIIRQPPVDDDNLNVEDNLEEFSPISDNELEHLRIETERLYTQTDKAILGNFASTAFGDVGHVPAVGLKYPKGIRDIEEWYVSTVMRRDYVYKVFERQCEIGLTNLDRIHQVVGDHVEAVWMTGTDFGTQAGPFISLECYRDLYRPFHKQVNDWVHKNTNWRTFIHSCGSVAELIEDFIEAGFDILNPVQCSAARMDAGELKRKFGDRLTFWGGGVDTQRTLPFGSPEQVRQEVRRRIEVFGPGGGFVYATVHNIQAGTPVGNLMALLETIQEHIRCPAH